MNYTAFASMKFSKTLRDCSIYDFYVWDCQTMPGIGKRSTQCALSEISEKDQTKEDYKGGDVEEIVEALMIDIADAIFVDNGTAGSICVLKMSDQHHPDLFVRFQNIEDIDVPLRKVTQSNWTSLRESFCLYGLDYPCGKLSGTIRHEVSAEHVTKLSTSEMKVGR